MISTQIVQFPPLFHRPLSDLRSDQFPPSRYRKPGNFAPNVLLFHSESMNIGPIANLTVGGERGAKTAQFAY
jgi:hypothetical protein